MSSLAYRFKTLQLALLLSTLLVLQGCGSKVDCNSSKVKEDALDIIQSHLNDAVWYKEMRAALSDAPELDNVKTLSRNDEVKQAACSAKYNFTYNGKPREVDVAYELSYLEDKGETEVRVAVNDVKTALIGIVMVERPIKNGVEKIIDPKTGNLQHKIEWKNGVQDGVEEIYNPTTNKLIAEIHMVNGKKAGTEKRWSDDGSTLLIDLNWVDGKATGFEKHVDPSTQKSIVDLVWKDGRATGFQTIGTTGQMSTGYDEYQLKDGQYDGVHKRYLSRHFSPYGMFLAKVENYKEGKLDGLVQEFNEDGKVVTETSYRNGVEGQASNISSKACLDSRIEKFHKEQGNEALISNDMITEWEAECRGNS